MFDKLYKAAGKILIYIMFIFLLLSFAAWGVGDILKGDQSGTIAEVNGTKITRMYIEELVQQRKNQIMQSTGGASLPDGFQTILESSILRQVINQQLFNAEINNLGIRVDGESVLKSEIAKDKTITKEKFKNFLRSMNKTESQYINELAGQKAIDYVEQAITTNPPVLDFIAKEADSFQNEGRTYQYIDIPASAIKKIDTPTDEPLSEYYEKNKQQFVTLEKRDVTILVVDKDALRNKDKGQSNIEKVETFKDAPGDQSADASNESDELYKISNEVLDRVAEGKSLEDIANEFSLKLVIFKNIDSKGKIENGSVAALPDIKDALKNIFLYEKGKTSDLLEGEKGYAMLRVDDIKPVRQLELSEVKPQVTTIWQAENTFEKLQKLAEEISEKAKSNGFEKTASEYGLQIKTSESVTRVSTDIASGLLSEIFAATDKSKITNAYPTAKGGFVVARLNEISPSKSSELDVFSVKSSLQEQVKDDLLQQYFVHLSTKYKVKVKN